MGLVCAHKLHMTSPPPFTIYLHSDSENGKIVISKVGDKPIICEGFFFNLLRVENPGEREISERVVSLKNKIGVRDKRRDTRGVIFELVGF